ncbi:MAG: hypothetical protein LBN43_07075 [Oscillospiraceae bacterium]|jgi:hypothetical protein|nr:hypothetical protein [Oscillospiraceae bacterium]
MGRTLKRVPLNFDYPINKVWYGYYFTPNYCHSEYSAGCDGCKKYAQIMGVTISDCGCPDFHKHYTITPTFEPPTGGGYQLWETTTEGSPQSPVFPTLNDLCEWCEKNATTFANFQATKEEWR